VGLKPPKVGFLSPKAERLLLDFAVLRPLRELGENVVDAIIMVTDVLKVCWAVVWAINQLVMMCYRCVIVTRG
jgi:hypothetical protein